MSIEREQQPEYSFVQMEVVHDLQGQHGWTAGQTTTVQQVVALHEIGHQFELTHDVGAFPEHVMTTPPDEPAEAQVPQMNLVFRDSDIRNIREVATDSTHAGP